MFASEFKVLLYLHYYKALRGLPLWNLKLTGMYWKIIDNYHNIHMYITKAANMKLFKARVVYLLMTYSNMSGQGISVIINIINVKESSGKDFPSFTA